MEVIAHAPIVKSVVDQINLLLADGPLPNAAAIKLTRAEMDELVAKAPFFAYYRTGNRLTYGKIPDKFYGEQNVLTPNGVEVTNRTSDENDNSPEGIKVNSFWLAGVKVYAEL
jgi:hypothetical protein